jgi:hypothetical protein
VTALLAASAVANAEPPSLETIVSRLALSEDAITLDYREIRKSSLLTDAVVTPGRIRIHGDGRIRQRWRGDDGIYRLRVDDDRVRLSTPQRERQITLSRRPRLEGLITALRALTQGDTARLRHQFDVTISGESDNWQLSLGFGQARQAGRGGVGQPTPPASRIQIDGGEGIKRIRLQGGQQDRLIIIEDGPR